MFLTFIFPSELQPSFTTRSISVAIFIDSAVPVRLWTFLVVLSIKTVFLVLIFSLLFQTIFKVFPLLSSFIFPSCSFVSDEAVLHELPSAISSASLSLNPSLVQSIFKICELSDLSSQIFLPYLVHVPTNLFPMSISIFIVWGWEGFICLVYLWLFFAFVLFLPLSVSQFAFWSFRGPRFLLKLIFSK